LQNEYFEVTGGEDLAKQIFWSYRFFKSVYLYYVLF